MDWSEYLTISQKMFATSLARKALERAIEQTLWRGRVLDLGAGGLRDVQMFLNNGFVVDAIDSAKGFASQESSVAHASGLRLHEALLEGELPQGVTFASYGVVMCHFTLPYFSPENFDVVINRLMRFPRKGGIVTFTLFGTMHQNHDSPCLRHSREDVDKIVSRFCDHGFAADVKQPIITGHRIDAPDWKGRKTHWHYYEIFLRRT